MIVCNEKTILNDEALFKHPMNLPAADNAGEMYRALSNIYVGASLWKS